MTFVSIARRWGLLVLGLVGIVVGAILLTRPGPPASFGWTAYAPLTNTVFVPPFVTPSLVFGVLLAALGIALVAGWVGFALGRRTKAASAS